jgi:hypothetical protein
MKLISTHLLIGYLKWMAGHTCKNVFHYILRVPLFVVYCFVGIQLHISYLKVFNSNYKWGDIYITSAGISSLVTMFALFFEVAILGISDWLYKSYESQIWYTFKMAFSYLTVLTLLVYLLSFVTWGIFHSYKKYLDELENVQKILER